jgi:DNA-binding HxlR family transcriptional regulator
LYSVSTIAVVPPELVALFHHRWAAPALALLDERGGTRFAELQRTLGVGRDSLRRALDALLALGYARRNEGYGHPLRPEYLITDAGRAAAQLARRVTRSPARDILLRKWSVPVLAGLQQPRRFSELRASLPAVTPRALALALQDLESAALIRRDVLPTRPPSALYQPTRDARLVLLGRDR